jgi:hypothetical protein
VGGVPGTRATALRSAANPGVGEKLALEENIILASMNTLTR